MSVIEKFVSDSVSLLPQSILDRGGRVLYSEAATVAPGSLYFLGINPKVDQSVPLCDREHHALRSIRRDLELLVEGRTTNAYLDESWKGRPPGTETLQERVQFVISKLGQDIRAVCASNLVFPRTLSADEIEESWYEDCWKVHSLLIDIVNPEWIVIAGGAEKGAERVASMLGGAQLLREECSPPFKLRKYELGKGQRLLLLPSLSRWAPNGNAGQGEALQRILS